MGGACGRDCLIGPAGVPNKNSVSSDISGMSPEYLAWHGLAHLEKDRPALSKRDFY